MGSEHGGKSGEVYFEFTQVGQQMRVAAIDAETATEVIVIAPLTATRTQMESVALAKLRRKLGEAAPGEGAKPSASPGQGATVIKTA